MPILRKRVKTNSKNKQTTTTNINYIKKFMSILKTKFNNKVNIPSDKTKTKKITYKSPENICDQSIKRFGNNYTKKNKNSKVKELTYFFETGNFKVINTIRNQLILLQINDCHSFYRRALGPVLIHFLKRLKRTTKKTETCQKTLSKPSSHILALKIYSIAPSSNSNNVVCGHSLVRLGNK